MSRTLKELAREAIGVQDASNLSGVVHSFSRAITDLREHGYDSATLNNHPITRLWVSKLAYLSDMQGDEPNFRASYDWCCTIAEWETGLER